MPPQNSLQRYGVALTIPPMKTKHRQFSARQGDVHIERIASLPAKRTIVASEAGRVILAHGETTGHCHAIADTDAALFTSDTDASVTFLEVRAAMAALTHEEHATIELPRGVFRVTRQREYSPQEIRRVAD